MCSTGYLTRPQVFTLTLCSFVLMSLGRLTVRAAVVAVTSQERCIVLGSAANARRIADKLADARSTNAAVVGRVAIDPFEPDEDADRRAPSKLGDFRSLVAIVGAQAVERVIIAPGHDGEDEILDAIRVIKALGVKVSVLPRLLEVVGSSSSFDDVNGIWLLGVRAFRPVAVVGGAQAGHGCDRCQHSARHPASAVPHAGARRQAHQSGPVFFRQKRIGRQGEIFSMLKLRSMVVGADSIKEALRTLNEAEGGLFKIDGGPPGDARRPAAAPHVAR